MDKFDRIHLLHRCLQQARYPVAATTLMERLECSRATLSRLIGYMRDFLGAPIESDHQRGGYRYARCTVVAIKKFLRISPAKSRGLFEACAGGAHFRHRPVG